MSLQVPCVVNNVGDCKFILENSDAVVNSFEPLEIANAWEKIYKMSVEGKMELGRKYRNRIREMFDINKIVIEYENLFLELSNEKK